MIEFTFGDMFETEVDVLVNTVNCVGVMGAGVALACKQKYPEMFKEYQEICRKGELRPGQLHIWNSLLGETIVNFPTKDHWKNPSQYAYVAEGLLQLREYLKTVGAVRVALPALGCGHGGLDWGKVSKMILLSLSDLPAHIYVFAPADSLRQGAVSLDDLGDKELEVAKQLGFELRHVSVPNGSGESVASLCRGDQINPNISWTQLFVPSDTVKPSSLVTEQLVSKFKRDGAVSAVVLLHAGTATSEVAQALGERGLPVIVVLPFGVSGKAKVLDLYQRLTHINITLTTFMAPSIGPGRKAFFETMRNINKLARKKVDINSDFSVR